MPHDSLDVPRSQYEIHNKSAIAIHLVAARATSEDPAEFVRDFRARIGARNASHADLILRNAVPAGTSEDPAWASPLAAGSVYTSALLETITSQSAFAALVAGGARQAPAHVMVPVALTGTTAAWVKSGGAVPMSKMAFGANVKLDPLKVGVISAFTAELLHSSQAEPIVRKDLGRAIVAAVDTTLLSADAAVPGLSPAGLLNGIAAAADITELVGAVASSSPSTLRFFTTKAGALTLANLRSPDGAALYPNLSLIGGSILGIPVVVTPAAGANVILVDADGIVTVDAGLELDQSEIAAIEMSDAPAMSSATPTGVNVVSLYQTNSTALRAIRFVNWARGRVDAVGFTPIPV